VVARRTPTWTRAGVRPRPEFEAAVVAAATAIRIEQHGATAAAHVDARVAHVAQAQLPVGAGAHDDVARHADDFDGGIRVDAHRGVGAHLRAERGGLGGAQREHAGGDEKSEGDEHGTKPEREGGHSVARRRSRSTLRS
jgi:hypothetical protein